MSKKLIWVIVIGSVLAIAGSGAAVAGFFAYRAYQDRQNFAQAEAYRAQGDLGMASNYYKVYLSRNRDDVDTLRTFAEMNEQILTGRRAALTTAANAYNQINTVAPDPELQDKVVALYEQVRSWGDVEYYAEFFLRNRPDDAHLKYLVAWAIDNQGRAEEARAAYQKIIDEGTTDPQVYANLAAVLHRQGFQEQSADVIAKLDQAFGDDPVKYIRMGEYFVEVNELDQAQAYVDKALALAPDHAEALFLRAQILLLQNKPEESIAASRSALEQAPDNARTHLMIAVAQNRLGDHAAAVETLKALDPRIAVDNPEVLLALAESQISANRLDDVVETIELYRIAYPEMRLTLDYLEGRKALASGNASQAAVALTNVVEMNPSFSSAQYYLAVALLQSQQRDRGRVVLESYLQKYPNDAPAQRLLKSEFGGPQDAADAAEQLGVLISSSTSPDEILAAVRPLLTAAPNEGQKAESNPLVIQALEKILQLDPAYERAHQSLIFYHAEHGNVAEARASLDRAKAAGLPENTLLMASAAVLLAEGQVDAARELYGTALARQDFTVDKALSWGNLFANQGHLEEGLLALQEAAAKNVGDASAIIDMERPVLMARHDALDRALLTLDELSVAYAQTANAQDRLQELKLQFAETLLQLKDEAHVEKAEQLLDQVSAAEPGNTRVFLIRAEKMFRQEPPKLNEGIELLDRALALDKNNVDALLMLAQAHDQLGEPELALEYGRRAADVSVGNLDAKLLIAKLQYNLQRHRECQETLESVLAAYPSSLPAMEMLAQSYMATGRTQLAQSVLDNLVAAAGADRAALDRAVQLRTRLMVQSGRRLDEAEAVLREQYAEQPDNATVAMDLAIALAGQGKLAEAETLLTTHAESQPDDANGWYILGQFYLDRNDPALVGKASSALTRALMIDPDHVPSLRGQIEAQARQGKAVETMQLADRYLTVRPQDDVVLFRKAAVLYQLNKMDDAFAAVNAALDVNDRPDYRYLRANIHLAKKEYQDALTDLQAITTAESRTANYDMATAEAYLGLGNRESALQFFDSAKRKNTTQDPVSPERIRRFEAQVTENPAA